MTDLPADPNQLQGFPHPRERARLIGHDAARQILTSALSGERFHHAWMIAGMPGIGKATLAYHIARHLLGSPIETGALSTDGRSSDIHDPDHPVFRLIASQSHPDLFVLARAYDTKTRKYKQSIAIDDVRGLKSFFGKTASRPDARRVAIIDAIDDMAPPAANALLKILEEPPSGAVFLIVANRPQRLLPTILSRCRRLDLRPLNAGQLAAIMSDLDQLDDHTPDQLQQLAALSGGSAARALIYARSGGLKLYEEVISLFETLPRMDLARLHALAGPFNARTAEAARNFAQLGDVLTGLTSRLARAQLSGDENLSPREAALAQALTREGSARRWADAFGEISHSLERANALNLDRRQTVLTCFFKLEEISQRAA